MSDRARGAPEILYAECEVRELWLLDLAGRAVDCLVHEGRAFVVSPPLGDRCRRLPEIALDLAAFWRELEVRLPRALGGRR